MMVCVLCGIETSVGFWGVWGWTAGRARVRVSIGADKVRPLASTSVNHPQKPPCVDELWAQSLLPSQEGPIITNGQALPALTLTHACVPSIPFPPPTALRSPSH